MKYQKNTNIIKDHMLAEVEVSYKCKRVNSERVKVIGPASVIDYVRSVWNKDTIEFREEMLMVLLNRQLQVLGWVRIGEGGTEGVVCDPKVVFSIALAGNAASIILVHNHPSGNVTPSQQDISISKRIIAAGDILDVKVNDFMIITADSYYSFTDNGIM